MPATLTITAQTAPGLTSGGAQALVTRSSPLAGQSTRSFGQPHWNLELTSDLDSAFERPADRPLPLNLCHAREWRDVAGATSKVDRPLVVFALADKSNDKEWLAALEKGVWYTETHRLGAPQTLSILNHAWRA